MSLVSERPIALNFPEYARIVQTDVALSDMSTRTISVTVKIDGDITPDFSYDWKMSFRGLVYILPVRDPQAVKENTSTLSEYDLTFTHEAIYKLQGEYYIGLDTQSNLWDKYDVPINLTLPEFVAEYDKVLVHLFGGSIRAELNPASTISEQLYVAITNVYMWDLLQQVYEIFGCRWYFVYDTDTEVHTIKFDYPSVELSHIFQYGYEGGLLSVTKGVQSPEIYNYVLGRGGDQNIPYRYFKDTDENNPLYRKDPDWVEELAFVYFSELRSKEYRDYIQGYKVRKKEQGLYSDYERVYEPTGRSEAYYKGYQDAGNGVFDPIEYVTNEESIDKYGVRKVKLANNEEAYPSIQGVILDGIGRVDEVVAVEQVLTDEYVEINKDYIEDMSYYRKPITRMDGSFWSHVLDGIGEYRTYSKGDTINVLFTEKASEGWVWGDNEYSHILLMGVGRKPEAQVKYDGSGSQSVTITIPSDGDYAVGWQIQYKTGLNPSEDNPFTDIVLTNIYSVGKQDASTPEYKETFDIWIKNLWQTTKLSTETEDEYVDRVWTYILGEDNEEAMVSFNSSTFLRGTDLEFMIVQGGVHYDTSKTYNGVRSEWRLTLAKSTTEVENGGLPIPNTAMQGQAGDLFFFTGIELPQQYVEWGETKVQDAKFEYMETSAQIQPSWSVSLDKVRAEEVSDDAVRMIESLDAGVMFRLYDEQLIDGSHFLNIYLQSINMSWGETDLIPETSFTLSQDVSPVINPVAVLAGEIDSLRNAIIGLGDIQKQTRMVGDTMYLLKNGTPDISSSPTTFKKTVKHADILQSENYRQGAISGLGWVLEERNGRSTLEVDDAVFRGNVSYNNLVINQISVQGGKEILSAAVIECTRVDDTDDGYVCYFDQKHGTVGNLFQVDDVAYSSVFDSNNIEIKSYKRRVIATDVNSITLSKTEVSGLGVPVESDRISHYGNYTNTDRQYVIIRDVIGGGNERMIEGLNSVSSSGYEYFFAGRETGQKPRLQFGDEKRGGIRVLIGDGGGDANRVDIWADSFSIKSPSGETVQQPAYMGEWVQKTYYFKEQVSHNGSTWECVVESTTAEPSTSGDWVVVVSKGDAGEQGAPGSIENLEIGGVNLINNSFTIDLDPVFYLYSPQPNTTYTLSIESSTLLEAGSGDNTKMLVYDRVRDYHYGYIPLSSTRQTLTFTTLPNANDINILATSNYSGRTQIRKVMLEQSTIASQTWRESPFDTQTSGGNLWDDSRALKAHFLSGVGGGGAVEDWSQLSFGGARYTMPEYLPVVSKSLTVQIFNPNKLSGTESSKYGNNICAYNGDTVCIANWHIELWGEAYAVQHIDLPSEARYIRIGLCFGDNNGVVDPEIKYTVEWANSDAVLSLVGNREEVQDAIDAVLSGGGAPFTVVDNAVVASNLFAARLAVNQAFIEDLTVKHMETEGGLVKIEADGSITAQAGNFTNVNLEGVIRMDSNFSGVVTSANLFYIPENIAPGSFSLGRDRFQVGKVIKIYNSNPAGSWSVYLGAFHYNDYEGGGSYQDTNKGYLILPYSSIEVTCFAKPVTRSGYTNAAEWVVTNRYDQSSAGMPLMMAMWARVKVVNGIISMKVVQSAGTPTLSINRTDVGVFSCRINPQTLPVPIGRMAATAQGKTSINGATIKCSLTEIDSSGYFYVYTSDDASRNDGDFDLIIYNTMY